jgi:hypothetical protein
MADEPDDALIEVADELYGLPPEEFTAARNARAKAAQSDGDRDLAGAIRTLAKPSAAAWLANQLVRQDRSALDPLLELGADLRAATAELDAPAMRALSKQQPQLVAGLVRQAAALAKDSGKPVSQGVARDLEDTLRAAIADADAADQLMAGHLANALQHNGFGLVESGNLTLVRSSSGSAPRARKAASGGSTATKNSTKNTSIKDEQRAERLAAAEQDVADAQAAVEVTTSGQEQAGAAVEAAQTQLEAAKEDLARLREELDRAKFALSRAEGELRQSKQSLEQAGRAARAAANGLSDATDKRDRLKA